MIVDTSALIAIILLEPEADLLGPKILSGAASMAAPNLLEAHMVLRKHHGDRTAEVLDREIRDLGIQVVPFLPEHAKAATQAFDRYGKGHHPAGLNFGDCIAYGLAKTSGQPLLFVGNDFSKTDVKVA